MIFKGSLYWLLLTVFESFCQLIVVCFYKFSVNGEFVPTAAKCDTD